MPGKLYYWCRNIRHNEKRPLIAVSIVLDDILEYLKTCRLDPGLISDARRKLQRREDQSSQQAQLLRHLQESYQRLQERYIDGGITKSFMGRKSEEIKAKIADAQSDMRYYPKSRILDDIPEIVSKLRQYSSAESCYCIHEALDIFIDRVVWGKEGIKEVKIYDEYKGFFPSEYKPKRRVSVEKLARACNNPRITAEILRRWNRDGIIHDIGRISGEKMYNLKESLRRIAITERMMARRYTLWQIRDLLDGKPLLATIVPISKEMNMPEHIVRNRLRKLLKPALIYGKTRIYCYRLDEAKKALSQSKDAS